MPWPPSWRWRRRPHSRILPATSTPDPTAKWRPRAAPAEPAAARRSGTGREGDGYAYPRGHRRGNRWRNRRRSRDVGCLQAIEATKGMAVLDGLVGAHIGAAAAQL